MARRRANRMRVAVEPPGHGRQIRRDKGHSLSGEAAERTLIATMAKRRVLGRSFVVVDLNAELRRVAKQRLEFGGDRRVIGAGGNGRGKSRRGRGGEKLNDQRKRDEECGQRRPERRQAALCAPPSQAQMSGARGPPTLPPMPYLVAEGT